MQGSSRILTLPTYTQLNRHQVNDVVHLRVYADSIKFCTRNSAARIVKMALSDTKVRSAKSEDKAYKLTDGNGLFLLVHPNGSKYWRFRYRFGGKEKDASIWRVP